jgi:hypothetical protein
MRKVSPFLLAWLLVSAAWPAKVEANCGSTSCPIEIHALPLFDPGRFSVDLSFQYIDQDQPMIGSDDAEVGEIPTDHDEVRTLNRVGTVSLDWRLGSQWELGLALPQISRFHEHLAAEEHGHGEEEAESAATAKHEGHEHEAEKVPEQFHLEGLGDLLVQGRRRLWAGGGPANDSLWATLGVELPTGETEETNDEGELGEVPIQPGSGSTDFIVGLAWRGGLVRGTSLAGPQGGATRLPYFVSASYRRNGQGTDDYRLGDEVQVNAGGAYPLRPYLQLLLQVNGRYRDKDSPGKTEEDVDFTGGTALFVSPGLHFLVGERWGGYAYVQVPVYQHVNQEQLTASANWFTGVQARF